MTPAAHPRSALIAILAFSLPAGSALAQNNVADERERKVAEDRAKMQKNAFWIDNDLGAAKQIATDAKKPMMVVFR